MCYSSAFVRQRYPRQESHNAAAVSIPSHDATPHLLPLSIFSLSADNALPSDPDILVLEERLLLRLTAHLDPRPGVVLPSSNTRPRMSIIKRRRRMLTLCERRSRRVLRTRLYAREQRLLLCIKCRGILCLLRLKRLTLLHVRLMRDRWCCFIPLALERLLVLIDEVVRWLWGHLGV